MKIVIIGSGFGGLGAAVRLAAQGHDVEVLEKRDKPGGRAYVYEQDGFRFDGGPTVITAPFLLDELFSLAGKTTADYITLKRLHPFYRIFNHEGRAFDYNDDAAFTLDQIGRWNPADREGYRKFISTTKAIFEKGFVELSDKPFLKVTDMLKVVPDLLKLQSQRSVYTYVSRFISDDFLRQVFSFHPLLVGGNPFHTTSIYALIHYLEREYGVHYAMGGTGTIVSGLVTLLEELGGRIRLNAEIDEILIDKRRATGVRLRSGEIISADAVVSNADVATTYRTMIPERHRRKWTNRRIDRLEYSMSLFVLYFGTKRRYTDTKLAHHNIILGRRYRELLADIFDRKILADDFSLYLHMPTLTDPSLAPEGHEAFYVLSPVPHLGADIDWAKTGPVYRDRIVRFLEEHYLPDLEENIVTEHMIDPTHFQGTLNSHLGAAFSVAPTLTQSAWFRPHNRSEEFDNLYIVGAGTHPGAGLPGVLSSAKIVATLIGGTTRRETQ